MIGSLARSAVSQIMKFINQITDGVTNPLKANVAQVVGGVWKGKGADRFVEEMNNVVVKQLENMAVNMIGLPDGVNRTIETIQNADKKAAGLISGLADQFKGIFSM